MRLPLETSSRALDEVVIASKNVSVPHSDPPPAGIGRHYGRARRIPKNPSRVSKLRPGRAGLRIAPGILYDLHPSGVEIDPYSR